MSSQRNNEPTSLAMRTQYYSASSLDGFISKPDDSLDWLFPLGDVNKTSYPSFLDDVGAIAMGSSTYGWMLQHTIKHGTDQATLLPGLMSNPPGCSQAAPCQALRALTSASFLDM